MPRRVEWRQLCAIAKDMIERDPHADDSTWCEAIKRRLVQLHLDYPSTPHDITAAMRAVERALAKLWGPRPAPTPPSAPPLQEQAPAIAPLSREEATAILAELAVTVPTMPRVRAMSPREADRRRARRVYAQALLEQVRRCEEAEVAATRAEAEDVLAEAPTP